MAEHYYLLYLLENILGLSYTPVTNKKAEVHDILQFIKSLSKSDAQLLKEKVRIRFDLNQIIFPIDLYNK